MHVGGSSEGGGGNGDDGGDADHGVADMKAFGPRHFGLHKFKPSGYGW